MVKPRKRIGNVARCKVKIKDLKGKQIVCGMPLNSTGQCPDHGRPY